eukprot:9473292-Pyramimonas_sp.AAC.1
MRAPLFVGASAEGGLVAVCGEHAHHDVFPLARPELSFELSPQANRHRGIRTRYQVVLVAGSRRRRRAPGTSGAGQGSVG